jgi:hypothetical protein
MNVMRTFVENVIGVTNFKPITKSESAIDATDFIVEIVTKWTNAMIATKSFADRVARCYRVNFVEEDCAKNAPLPVDGTLATKFKNQINPT